eukprot:89159-Pelagomonas_calceolata.AAC.2
MSMDFALATRRKAIYLEGGCDAWTRFTWKEAVSFVMFGQDLIGRNLEWASAGASNGVNVIARSKSKEVKSTDESLVEGARWISTCYCCRVEGLRKYRSIDSHLGNKMNCCSIFGTCFKECAFAKFASVSQAKLSQLRQSSTNDQGNK